MRKTHPFRIRVLILNPKVGEMSEISSLFNFFNIVVFPALSRPLKRSAKLYASSMITLRSRLRRIGDIGWGWISW